MQLRNVTMAVAAVLIAAAIGTAVHVSGKAPVANDATVQFGQHQPQTPDPVVGTAVTNFLFPDDVTIAKGGTVTFVVNGGGHGIAIHEVDKKTTRADIAEDLCDGATPENADPIIDRRNRAAVCNGGAITIVDINGQTVTVTGTQNLEDKITDGKGSVVIK